MGIRSLQTLSLILTLSLSADESMLSRTQMHMGTLVTISLPSSQVKWIQKGFERIHEIEMALSSYASKAEVYRLNHGETVSISYDTYEALLLSQRYYAQTNGYFDITVGSITKDIYRFGEDERLAEEDELDLALIKNSAIIFSEQQASLETGVTIDLGGMGKGYAVDKVAELFRRDGIVRGSIAASGDIHCLDLCDVKVQDPFGEGVVASFRTSLPNVAISTSGNYRRYVQSKKDNHLIDPKRKRSQQEFASITLVGQLRNSDLDAYATAASVMPSSEAIEFLDTLKVGYLLITTNGKVIEKRMSAYTLEFGSEVR